MPKLNLNFFLNSYNDLCQTSTPLLNQFKWNREINGVPFTYENNQQIQVLPSITTANIVPYPFSTPTNSGSAVLNATTTLTISGSTTGIAKGQIVVGTFIPVNTTVISITGSTVVMSNAATSSATETVSFYSPAGFIYFESDQPVSVIYNNGSTMAVNPFQINGNLQPGVLFLAGPCYSFTVTNSGTNTANLFFASMG
jgi:hypothetical protein